MTCFSFSLTSARTSARSTPNTNNMALLPVFYRSHAFPAVASAVNTVEVYLDYACPFSAKLFINWYDNLYPQLNTKYPQVQIVLRNYVQVWHPTSNLLHEASLSVAKSNPDLFLAFSYELFKNIESFYDSETFELTRHQIYELIYSTVVETVPELKEIKKDEFLGNLFIKKSEKPSNGGNKVTNDLKYFTKVGRQNGIHVTPTVLINGFKDGSIESSTSIEEIEKKLAAL